jgi:hypothetical protein
MLVRGGMWRFEGVADDTVLGSELPDARVRGMTVEDEVVCISEGIDRKKHEGSSSRI